MRASLRVLALAALVLVLGCWRPVASPDTPSTAEVGVLVSAELVHATDVACAGVSRTLREAGRIDEATRVSGVCSKALRVAAISLDSAASALDAGKSWESGDVACAIVRSVDAALGLHPMLATFGVKFPEKIDRMIEFVEIFTGVCE